MTQDEIIEMATQAKLDKELADDYCRVEYWTATEDELIAFAKLVAAKEREVCMNVLRSLNYAQSSKYDCIDVIRARGEA